MNTSNIKVYLNNELVCNQELNPDEKLDNLYKNIKNKIPNNSTIKFEDTELTIEEAKNEEMTVKELSTDNSIYFINKEIKNNSEIPKELKSEKKVENPNEINENNDKKDSSEKFIHIYKNGEVIKMGLFDTKMSLDSLRNLLKNNI